MINFYVVTVIMIELIAISIIIGEVIEFGAKYDSGFFDIKIRNAKDNIMWTLLFMLVAPAYPILIPLFALAGSSLIMYFAIKNFFNGIIILFKSLWQ